MSMFMSAFCARQGNTPRHYARAVDMVALRLCMCQYHARDTGAEGGIMADYARC